MDENASLMVAINSKSLAQKYASEKNFGRAFSHYLVALSLRPDWKGNLKEEFSFTLCKWGTILEENNRMNDLFQCYEKAIEIFSDNEIILNNLGAHLLRCHLLKEAAYYFQKSLHIQPNFVRARYNLENVSNLAVERWHFRMLNDDYRNKTYRKAIVNTIKQGFHTVLDIGTGTGLLSLFCKEGKASKIYACDSSPVMIEIAEMVFRKNNASDIKLISKHSSNLCLPMDIPEKVSLIVTETLDSCLFGENILQTLYKAWTNLLQSRRPGHSPRVIPFGAKMYVTGIECDSISSAFYVKKENTFFSFGDYIIARSTEDYDTQNLKHVDYKFLTNTDIILDVNFNDPDFIKKVLDGDYDKEFKIMCTKSGRLDCLAVWFDLLVDEDLILNTGPLSKTNDAWDQAIFALEHSVSVNKFEGIPIRASFKDGKVKLKCLKSECAQQNLLLINEKLTNVQIFQLSESAIKTLNNTEVVRTLFQVKNKLMQNFDHSVRILDWCPFSVFGINFLKERTKNYKDELISLVTSDSDGQLIYALAHKFGFGSQITVENESYIDNYFGGDKKFDIIILNMVDLTGELSEICTSRLENLRMLLKPDGILLPEEVTLVGQLVHSNWLHKMSRVLEEKVTCGYYIAEYINKYQVRHFIDIDLAVEKVPASNPIELLVVDSKEVNKVVTIPCFSNQARINAMVYWFKIKYLNGCDTVNTNNSTSTFHQSAFLCTEIEPTDNVKCTVIYSDGLINIDMST